MYSAVLAMLAVLDISRQVGRAAEHAMCDTCIPELLSYETASNTHVKDTGTDTKSKRQPKRGEIAVWADTGGSANELPAPGVE